MKRWAKVPIAWAKSEVVGDPVRVWLAISDQLRGLKRAKVRMELVLESTELPEARVSEGIQGLVDLGAISFDNCWVEIQPNISRTPTRVDIPLEQVSLDIQGRVKENKGMGNSTRVGVRDTFEEKNRIAKVRTKAIRWVNEYFGDPSWYKPARKRRFWERLNELFEDELAPVELREEITGLLREKAGREYKKIEEKRGMGTTGHDREPRNHRNGAVDSRDRANLSKPCSGSPREPQG